MNLFQDVMRNTHSLKEDDFSPDEIYHLKGDKIHKDEIQVFMTIALRDGQIFILNAFTNQD